MVVSIINTGDDLIKIKEREATAWMDGHARSLVNHACEVALSWTDGKGASFMRILQKGLESIYLIISFYLDISFISKFCVP